MKVEIVTITPQTAAAWLEANMNFRRPIKGYAERLAKDIASGRWDVNGDAIRFDDSGNLKDGQHRLLACVIAKTSFRSLVVWGIESDTNIDAGVKRSIGQLLHSRGEVSTNKLAAAIRIAWYLESGMKSWTNNDKRPTNQVLLAWFDANPTIRESLRFAGPCSRVLPESAGAALHDEFSNKDQKMANDFVAVLAGKMPLSSGDPVMMLRERLIQDAGSKFKMNQRQRLAYSITAWNYWRKGTSIKFLRWSESGVNAQEFPSII
jgi:hypothetical protein